MHCIPMERLLKHAARADRKIATINRVTIKLKVFPLPDPLARDIKALIKLSSCGKADPINPQKGRQGRGGELVVLKRW